VGDNWGLELMRVPQLWNFNHAVTKQGSSAIIGVLDDGFNIAHPDLLYLQNLSPGAWANHGTHVAGTIGAAYNNSVDVDGVNPFAGLVVQQHGWGFIDFLFARTDLQVV
jgi:subtilisin family serine protease